MNIFKKYDAWLGSLPPNGLAPIPTELVQQICEIKQTLGRKGYLLDKYLIMLFKGFSTHLSWCIVEHGSSLYGRLQRLCATALDGKAADDPFLGRVAAYVQSHPLEYDSRYTKIQIYTLRLAEEFLQVSIPEMVQKCENKISNGLDIILLDELFRDIAEFCGENRMQALNEIILKQYANVTIVNLLLQGFYSSIFYSFTDRDDESGREIFLLMLDEIKSI